VYSRIQRVFSEYSRTRRVFAYSASIRVFSTVGQNLCNVPRNDLLSNTARSIDKKHRLRIGNSGLGVMSHSSRCGRPKTQRKAGQSRLYKAE